MALMLHPAYNNPHPGLEGYHLQNVIGNQLETTIAAERLIVTSVLDRHPGLRLLLVHAGGYMPWQAGRLRHAATVRTELADSPRDPHDYFGRVFVDTITHDPAALRFLVERVGAGNVAMGTRPPVRHGHTGARGGAGGGRRRGHGAACDGRNAATAVRAVAGSWR